MKENKLVEFCGTLCKVVEGTYINNRKSIRLVDFSTGEPIAHATINVTDTVLDEDELVIKDYGENKGLLRALLNAGILVPTGRLVVTGYEMSMVCKLC